MRNITEEVISGSDLKTVFRNAATMRDKPALAGRMFKGLRKDKIELTDLHRAWIEAGQPDDTEDIAAILRDQFGFSPKEIKKVYLSVFGASDEEEFDMEGAITPAVQKVADYAIKNGLVDELKSFLEKQYGEELGLTKSPGVFDKLKGFLGRKAVAEDVRQIFMQILSEERNDRAMLIKQMEYTQFGRKKK